MIRTIDKILQGSPFHMVGDGFRVRNYFPNGNHLGRRFSPFFLLDYHPAFHYPAVPEGGHKRGVGVHPHRGFETVTLALEGSVAHHDSAGNSGVIGPGEVQWMTAASGVLHKEYHEEKFSRAGGIFHMLQLWVNLPSQHKMDAPSYQALSRELMANVAIGNGSNVMVIAGEYHGVKGPARTHTLLSMYVITLKKGDVFEASLPAAWNTGVLVTDGLVQVLGKDKAQPQDFVLFANDGEDIRITAENDARLVLLSGEPIDEPIAHYGPFLMNTQEELAQAFEDFNAGKFGVLAEDQP
jgi:redox-sensitive bicupin YhaK (pirin superfamily)